MFDLVYISVIAFSLARVEGTTSVTQSVSSTDSVQATAESALATAAVGGGPELTSAQIHATTASEILTSTPAAESTPYYSCKSCLNGNCTVDSNHQVKNCTQRHCWASIKAASTCKETMDTAKEFHLGCGEDMNLGSISCTSTYTTGACLTVDGKETCFKCCDSSTVDCDDSETHSKDTLLKDHCMYARAPSNVVQMALLLLPLAVVTWFC